MLTPADVLRLPPALQDEYLAVLRHLTGGGEGVAEFIGRVYPRRVPPVHTQPLIRAIERARHKPIRLCVSMPPRHVKTTTALSALAWWAKTAPADTNAYFSYNATIGRSKSRLTRALALRGGVQFAKDSKRIDEWRTPEGGGLIAGGIGTALTGQGISGLFVIDDPYKDRKQADSEIYREHVWEWFTEVALTRLEGASVIVTHTRWHPDDLIGRLELEGWDVINFPALAEENDPLGRAAGECLWPGSRFTREYLEALREEIGEWSFAALYQGRPRPRGATVFKEPARFTLAGFSIDELVIKIGGDPAASEDTAANYSVAIVMGRKGRGPTAQHYILDLFRGQVTVPAFARVVLQLQKTWGGAPAFVESVAGFKALPQIMKDMEPGLRVYGVTPKGDKFLNAQPVAAAWNSGRVLVPIDAAWAPGLLAECSAFTGIRDKTDDQVDALARAYNSFALEVQPAKVGVTVVT